jgi:2-polyprenyl-6-methoxyphenol hydroxylase-like FAD-dependent oxidoreductase
VLHNAECGPTVVLMTSRIAVVGGGPGGLFFATLVRRALPTAEVTLFERNQASDAFGFGVVFSDATLRKIDAADPVLRNALSDYGRHWDRIDVWSRGEQHGFSGNGMAAIHRKVLLRLLQENALEAGVDLRFGQEAPPVDQLAADYDLVVGADGTNSVVRDHLGELGHTVETATAKFIWFGTKHIFDGLTFVHRVSEHGAFAVHGYPISDELSTFIVETDEETWRRAGMDEFDVSQPPGPSDKASQDFLEKLFAEDIGGASLVTNNSRWGNFRTRRTQHWYRDNVALLGDAVHTAHFSVGSGTKMAMEDAVTLAEQVASVFRGERDLESALSDYQEERAASVRKIQDSARPSLAWWERFGLYQRELDPLTFTFHFFSRSIGIAKIAQRDPALAEQVRGAWTARHGTEGLTDRLLQSPPNDVPLVLAPADERDLPEAIRTLPQHGAVVIDGTEELPKVLLSEEARLRRGLTTFLMGDYDEDAAETLLLSGRCDGVVTVPAPPDEATR